jgi:hypothetical protein
MTDIFDRASEKEERDRDLAIRAARAKNQPLKITGFCLFCNEALSDRRFCSAECREDYEMVQNCRRISGHR